jgi:hypothetical protein
MKIAIVAMISAAQGASLEARDSREVDGRGRRAVGLSRGRWVAIEKLNTDLYACPLGHPSASSRCSACRSNSLLDWFWCCPVIPEDTALDVREMLQTLQNIASGTVGYTRLQNSAAKAPRRLRNPFSSGRDQNIAVEEEMPVS